ncbi:hypothetical protein VTN00DRAFT_5029 [Thermoascus crustaceus]|uniref:uncharacterized protein n=1 Tax=Thermoascus crustaceus TaxID=5088 RepID=UPI0037442898
MPLFSTTPHSHPYAPRRNPYPAHLAAAQASKVGRIGRWYLPAMVLVCLGFGISNHLDKQKRVQELMREMEEEQNRMQQTAALMDAFGDRSSLDNVQRAMEIYEGKKDG